MMTSGRVDCELRAVIPASLDAMESFFGEFHARSAALRGRADCFAAEILLREALTNAVMHGCGADPGRQVRCLVRLRGRTLLMVIADDGEGFDWRAALGRERNFSECSGRGLGILHKYANHVRYNNTGNAVMMIKRFG